MVKCTQLALNLLVMKKHGRPVEQKPSIVLKIHHQSIQSHHQQLINTINDKTIIRWIVGSFVYTETYRHNTKVTNISQSLKDYTMNCFLPLNNRPTYKKKKENVYIQFFKFYHLIIAETDHSTHKENIIVRTIRSYLKKYSNVFILNYNY